MNKWVLLKFYLYHKPKGFAHSKESARVFFQENVAQVKAITNLFADEKSREIYNQVIKLRQTMHKQDIPWIPPNNVPYFIDEIKPKLGKDEVFIDCGAFDGDTIDAFLKQCPEYKQIIAFEPETVNFGTLQARHKNTPKMQFIKAGVWDNDETVSFSGDGQIGMIIAGGGGDELVSIQVRSIDNLNLEKVTFIKMDIEGAEMKALKGAEKTILRDKPKLAICIYHSDKDMIDIPKYIHSLVPEYKLYVRHHLVMPHLLSDTVLYAIM